MSSNVFDFAFRSGRICPYCTCPAPPSRGRRCTIVCPGCLRELQEDCLLDADALERARLDADRLHVVWYPRWRVDMRLVDPSLIAVGVIGLILPTVAAAISASQPPRDPWLPIGLVLIGFALVGMCCTFAAGSVSMKIEGDRLLITRTHTLVSHARSLPVRGVWSVALERHHAHRRGSVYSLVIRAEKLTVRVKHAARDDLAYLQAILTERLYRTPPPHGTL